MSLLARIKAGIAAYNGTSGNYSASFGAPVMQLDVEQEELYQNSAVMSVLNWTVSNAGQARLELFKRVPGADQDEIQEDSKVAAAWEFGHPMYGRDHVEAGMWLSLLCEGTSFTAKLRDSRRQVAGYQWLPHYWCSFERRGDVDVVMYRPPGGAHYEIPLSEVIINRIGVDPEDDRKGYSPIKACLREVMTDQEASQYMRVVLKNFGVIGGIMSPKAGTQSTEDQIKRLRTLVREGTTGENRGYMVMPSYPVDYQEISASPEKLVLEKARRIPEERISAVFNIPAVVLGLGAGLDKSTYNNVKEAKKAAWNNFLIPLQGRIARQWNRQMLPEFETDPKLYLEWDRKHIEALQEDEDAKAKRYSELFKSDVMRRNEVRRVLDLKDDPEDGFYSALTRGSAEAAAKAELVKRINDRTRFDG